MMEQDARQLMQSAYENRYTWDKNFPGYTADVQLKVGDQVYRGKVKVNSNLSAEVIDVADEQAKQAIQGQLQEVAIHRIRRSFEDTHGKNTFAFGETDATGAAEILVGGKSEGDRYKVRNNEVCMVHRHIHGIVVTIDTHSSHQTGEGYLSHRYHSVYRDPKTGELKGEQDYEDNYEKVGDYQILSSRTIRSIEDGQPVVSEFSFSNIKLLQPALV
ncbi:DUF3386 domain-containing protein [Leptolyngbya sp. NK1-12]|uniref:DUF3386 domain-containing protein n=1 Tax=Leptolyngbya sp. NK1-12 TaxID=2547451 RepID=A0AA96WHF3_9CYAN|nr:DUF3386 domain-containing protein [Leptolyngbya sp. NK1-12]WNZ24695.1 DUF3386 domain-containing protein [Leptolyngbya sp. NK1-12]